MQRAWGFQYKLELRVFHSLTLRAEESVYLRPDHRSLERQEGESGLQAQA